MPSYKFRWWQECTTDWEIFVFKILQLYNILHMYNIWPVLIGNMVVFITTMILSLNETTSLFVIENEDTESMECSKHARRYESHSHPNPRFVCCSHGNLRLPWKQSLPIIVGGIDYGYILKCLCLYFSFGMTENYFVFLEQPMYINVMKLFINKIWGQPMIKGLFEYDSEEKVNDILVHV